MSENRNFTSESKETNDDRVSRKKLLFAFYFFEGHGHINPAISLSRELRQRGHDTVLLCINDIGYTDERIVCLMKIRQQREKEQQRERKIENEIEESTIRKADDRMVEQMQHVSYGASEYETFVNLFENMSRHIDQLSDPVWDQLLREVIVDLEPDVVIVDHAFAVPAIMRIHDPSTEMGQGMFAKSTISVWSSSTGCISCPLSRCFC